RFAPDFRVRAGSESVLPDADFRGGLGDPQRLHVRIHRDELDTFQACCDHRVDGVAAAPADANDLDLGRGDRLFFKLEHAIPPFVAWGLRAPSRTIRNGRGPRLTRPSRTHLKRTPGTTLSCCPRSATAHDGRGARSKPDRPDGAAHGE